MQLTRKDLSEGYKSSYDAQENIKQLEQDRKRI